MAVLIEARCFQCEPTAGRLMVWSCSPHIPSHRCLPRNPLVGQSQAPSTPREPACCWHRHLQSGAAMSCTSPTDMGCSWYYNISEGATYTPTSSREGKRGTELSVCSFLSKSNVQRQVKQALWGVQADFFCELTMPEKVGRSLCSSCPA